MPYTDYRQWLLYFAERPYGWREDDRTMKLLQAQGTKAAPGSVFASLGAIARAAEKRRGDGSELKTLKGSMMFTKMLGAIGGDKLEV